MTSCADSEPLLLRRSEHDGGRSSRMLARRAQRGELVRLAPGTYVATRRWLLLPRHERHRVVTVAFADSRRRPVTFCGTTALELLGYPVVDPAPMLHVRAAHRGDSGTTRQPSPYVNEQAVLRTAAGLGTQGLMDGDGRVPMLPLVRQHWNLPGAGAGAGAGAMGTGTGRGTGTGTGRGTGTGTGRGTGAGTGAMATGTGTGARATGTGTGAMATGTGTGTMGDASRVAPVGSPSHGPVEVGVRMDDGTVLGRVRVDPLVSAMATVFGGEPLSIGTAPADAIKRDHPAAETLAGEARELLRTGAQRTRFDAQWRFADARAESAGESLSRAVIQESGFVVPDLQYEVRASTGDLIARTDFCWEEIRLTAEFDGLVKYSGRLARPGATGPVGQDALVREKRREDAIRRAEYGVARWIWADLFARPRFVAMLEQHGVPRRRR